MRSFTRETETRTIPFGRPWLNDDDRRAVVEVLGGHILTHGPEGQAFESELAAFVGEGAHCVAVSSCMAALHLAYLNFGIGPGDEVILPAQTHVATAHAAEWVGATSVFVDCDPATGNVTAEHIRAAITPRTTAISVVHFVGIPCPMSEIVTLAAERGLTVIEDCALAVGARANGTHVGLLGDAGCFSFYPVKHITTGEGGMLVTRRGEVAERVNRLRALGVDRTHVERSVPPKYDVPSLGLNYRLSEAQAALGRSQLRRIDENLERRRSAFEVLTEAVGDLEGIRVLDGAGNSHYCLSLVLEGQLAPRRDELAAGLEVAGIGTSLYYPQPVPRMAYYREKYGYDASRFPNAEAISDDGIALPVGPHLDDRDVRYIAEVLRRTLEELGR